ncbi:MAG: hypothetical protein GF392_04755, partial [Candidatus Omnitrophica bacterium]|nr:hypothetical protein [Candidatus Omnitrophota bacterium]
MEGISTAPVDNGDLRLFVDGDYSTDAVSSYGTDSGWTRREIGLSAGTHTLRWMFDRTTSEDIDTGAFLDDVRLDLGGVEESFEHPAGSVYEVPGSYTTGETGSWVAQNDAAWDTGGLALRSGTVESGGSSFVERNIEMDSAGTLTFKWMTTLPGSGDAGSLHLYIDGDLASDALPPITGDTGWLDAAIALEAGTHTIRWVYDRTGASGAHDGAFVDELRYEVPETLYDMEYDGLVTAPLAADYTTGTNGSWTRQNALASDDVGFSLGAGQTAAGESSWVERTLDLTSDGTLHFDWRTVLPAGTHLPLTGGYTTGGDALFYAERGVSRDEGGYAARAGAVYNGDVSVLERSFMADYDTRVSFDWLLADGPGKSLAVEVDGVQQQLSGAAGEWNEGTVSVAGDGALHTVRWIYSDTASAGDDTLTAWIDHVLSSGDYTTGFEQASDLDDFEQVLTTTESSYTNTGSISLDSSEYHSGSSCIKLSGDNNQFTKTWISKEVELTRDGTVSFWWNAGGYPGDDYLYFNIGSPGDRYDDYDERLDAASSTEISGWQYVEIALSAGTHELYWVYQNDYNNMGPTDCGWVDNIKVTSEMEAGPQIDTEFNSQLAGTDSLHLYADGDLSTDLVPAISGEGGWESAGVALTAGTHTLRWVYDRTDSTGGSFDGAFVDEMYFEYAPFTEKFYHETGERVALSETSPAYTTDSWTLYLNPDGDWVARTGDTGQTTSFIERSVTVEYGSTISFDWDISSPEGTEQDTDVLSFYIDSTLSGSIDGTTSGERFETFVSPGTYTLRWEYDRTASTDTSDGAFIDDLLVQGEEIVPPGSPVTEGFEDSWDIPDPFSYFTDYYSYGDVAVTDSESYDGSRSVMLTGNGEHDTEQALYTQVTVNSYTELSFWWKVSSESGYDHLRFRVNSTIQDEISGEQGWTEVVHGLDPGTYELSWEYAKDGSLSEGDDAGYVDAIELPGSDGGTVTHTYASDNFTGPAPGIPDYFDNVSSDWSLDESTGTLRHGYEYSYDTIWATGLEGDFADGSSVEIDFKVDHVYDDVNIFLGADNTDYNTPHNSYWLRLYGEGSSTMRLYLYEWTAASDTVLADSSFSGSHQDWNTVRVTVNEPALSVEVFDAAGSLIHTLEFDDPAEPVELPGTYVGFGTKSMQNYCYFDNFRVGGLSGGRQSFTAFPDLPVVPLSGEWTTTVSGDGGFAITQRTTGYTYNRALVPDQTFLDGILSVDMRRSEGDTQGDGELYFRADEALLNGYKVSFDQSYLKLFRTENGS